MTGAEHTRKMTHMRRACQLDRLDEKVEVFAATTTRDRVIARYHVTRANATDQLRQHMESGVIDFDDPIFDELGRVYFDWRDTKSLVGVTCDRVGIGRTWFPTLMARLATDKA